MNSNSESISHWQQATTFFKSHYSKDFTQIQNLEVYDNLTEPVRLIVNKLFSNKQLKNTFLEQPTNHLTPKNLIQDLTGQQVDTYYLVGLIAHGGMSSVYRARKSGIKSQKDVAIKVIPANLQTKEVINLFKRELDTLSKLHHPNIISMHHGDVSQAGTPYMVMELVENALEIDQFFIKRQSSTHEIIEYFITLCSVISYAHQNSIIHQDIKPSNVLMDEHGHLLVLDFGVSALTEAIPEHHAYTLNYAAPEQTKKNQCPMPYFDTYAITSLLIKCLSKCADHETNWQIKALRNLDLDHDLKTILRFGTAQKSTACYQNVESLSTDLNLWKKKLPISHFKNKPLYRLKKGLLRHPGLAWLSISTVIMMSIGIIFYQRQYHLALSESNKAQQVKNILIEAINQNDPDISKGVELTVRDMLNQVEVSHIENPTADTNTAIEIFLTLSQAFNKLGDYEASEKNINRVLELDPNNIQALYELAELKLEQLNLKRASELLTLLNDMAPDNSEEHTIKLKLLAAKLSILNSRFEDANKQFTEAILLAKNTEKPVLIIKALAAQSNGYFEQDHLEKATEIMAESVSLSEKHFGISNSKTLELKVKLAEFYLSVSGEKITYATEIFEQIIPLQKRILGDFHPVVAKSLFMNATALRVLNRATEAKDNALEALTIAQQQFGDDHVFTGKVLMSLGAINLQEKNVSKALKYAKKAVENHEKLLGKEHPETLQYKTSYVAMLVEDEQHEIALELLQQIHPIQTDLLGSEHRGTLYVDIVLSKTYLALNRLNESVLAGERCLNNAQKSDAKNIMEVFCAITLENAYFKNQQYDQSKLLIEQYQNDELVVNRPKTIQQFKAHMKIINSQPQSSITES